MVNPYMKPLHAEPGRPISPDAPNAALLIDFDNVTMGMRSDLAKELKNLLNSDIIKGKVTVQRAYADWRRYPQYIVPLSEASIDLIFAPAYGSSKKNATDIRMAIDGIELVFIRPEIGTFILLTGDSDFSSLVLKLKEYGKYVIGIGMQESSSDILVQNCDEYYSYTALTGLSRASEDGAAAPDAWECVEEAVDRMVSRGDVMRSDRLKQVMMELAPGFDERSLGFKNFSKFLLEAAKKGLVEIQRGANGQYQVGPAGGGAVSAKGSEPRPRTSAANGNEQRGKTRRGPPPRRGPADRGAKEARRKAPAAAPAAGSAQPAGNAQPAESASATAVRERARKPDRAPALRLLARAVRELGGSDSEPARDSDVKRRMLSIDRRFNEGALGFGKFSKFLLYAETEGAVSLERARGGSFGVRLAAAESGPGAPAFDAKALGLPATENSIKSYLAHRYKGVGVKTAARLVDHFGPEVFQVLHNRPERVKKVLLRARAESVLTAWASDFKRRSEVLARQAPAGGRDSGEAPAVSADGRAGGRRGRRGARRGSAGAERRGPGPRSGEAVAEQGGAGASAGAAGAAAEAGGAAAEAARVSTGAVRASAEADPPARQGLLGLLPWGRRSRRRPDEEG